MVEEFDPDNFPEPIEIDYIPIDLFKAIQRPAWQDMALCKDEEAKNLEVFFPENKGQGGNPLAIARKICLECAVRYECLRFGIDEPDGVWGGHSTSQRRKISLMLKKGSSLIEASEAIDARSRDNARR